MDSTPTARALPGDEHPPLREIPARLVRSFASLFETYQPAAQTNTLTLGVLLVILVLGTALRFWGLGSVGLHGDEETMAMPTMHIVASGSPLLPSGMLYPRAIGQLYLMAGAVMAFGQSEWSMRLPSALCGVLMILLAYRVGRRFLAPVWNLAFTAAIAFLPEFIVDAQTARMYAFLVACVAGYILLLFEWERSDRVVHLVAATVVLLIGVQFQTLAVFSAFLALYPGLVRGELRKVVLGAIAFAVIVLGFGAMDHFINIQYPRAREVQGDDGGAGGARAAEAIPQLGLWLLAAAAVGAAAVATFVVRRVNGRFAAIAAGTLIGLGLLAQVAFCYHLALLLMVAGLVIAHRQGGLTTQRLVPLVVIALIIAAAQIFLLHANGVTSARQLFGAMTGRPSIWPYFVIAEYSVVAGLLLAGGIVVALWAVAQRRPAPDHVLFAVLGVWVPLLLIGIFKWNVPLRYTSGQVFPLLLCAFAVAQWAVSGRGGVRAAGNARWHAVAAIVTCILVVNPVSLARTANSGYRDHPDHQGAAAFIKSL
ncbi:MAG TPA: glycosyltransferase family 39 protein, partial [Steroidobacteraceae bacterium]|nr:glycosyltransferase family 39 protein [Steroidobacteraceae bacterium]